MKQTLPKNLKDNDRFPVEFVVLDYNSPDGLEAWIRTEMRSEVEAGRVRYVRERTAKNFLMAHAKNLAQMVATGDVHCALDADNFTGPEWAVRLFEVFADPTHVFVRYDTKGGGDHGRLVHRKGDFFRMRGYDETFRGWSYTDDDLIWRSTCAGLKVVRVKAAGHAVIEHDDDERFRYLSLKDRQESLHFNSALTRARGPVIAVNPGGWGQAVVQVNFDEKPVAVGVGPLSR